MVTLYMPKYVCIFKCFGTFCSELSMFVVAMCSATLLSGLQGTLKVWNHTKNYNK